MAGGALAGKLALVTGASRGLGRAVVEALQEAGARVIAVARASADMDSLAASLQDRADAWAVDVTGEELPDRIGALPRLDILVNNAGSNDPKPLQDCSDELLDRLLDLNVRSVFRVTRAAAARMSRGCGIVSITSQMGHVGAANRSVYCMTKHAIEGMTRALAVELAPAGIRVNAVAPTFIRTPLTEPMLADAAFRASVENAIPLGKIGEPSDVASAVVYLASDEARMITGHSLRVDGGWTAR